MRSSHILQTPMLPTIAYEFSASGQVPKTDQNGSTDQLIHHDARRLIDDAPVLKLDAHRPNNFLET